MSVKIKGTTIITFQGDTCEITFTDLEAGKLIGFGVRDKETNELVFDELQETVNNSGEVTFVITPAMSNKFVVDVDEGFNTYYYGIKQIESETEEHTIFLGDETKFSDKYILKVYLKKVEGNVENG